MNAERFENLAQAYGGDIRRWPQAEQPDAFLWLEANAQARAQLLQAGALDALLNASAPMTASGVLRERILAGAPRRRAPWRRAATWMSGAGLAAACAAGVILGANLSGGLLADPASDTLADATSTFDGTTWFSGLETEG